MLIQSLTIKKSFGMMPLMSPMNHKILTSFSALALVLSLTLLVWGIYNQTFEARLLKKQNDLNQLQTEVNRGQVSLQYFRSIIQDLGEIQGAKSKDLLKKYSAAANQAAAQATP